MPLLPLWAFVACSMMHFAFTFITTNYLYLSTWNLQNCTPKQLTDDDYMKILWTGDCKNPL